MSDIHLTIDGRDVTIPAGSTILDGAKALEIPIPTLCHMEGHTPFTSCFLCVVEVEGVKNPVPSCSTAAAEGMVVHTLSDRIRQTRKLCLELLASEHTGDCYGHCHVTCPAGIEIPQFVSAIARGESEEALRILKRRMPLPSSLGRVCTRPCEAVCRRGQRDEAVAICSLKVVAGDPDLDGERRTVPECAPDTGKKVAVIGAGPAGISAAFYLRQMGHEVTVIDGQETVGGMLRWGIPAFRLPSHIIEREFRQVEQMGARLEFGRWLGRDFTLGDLRAQGYDAVFLGLGAQAASSARIPGEDTPGVMPGIEILAKASRGQEVDLGDTVMVVGGGNTAMDCCRTALRLQKGKGKVILLYRRTRAEMPALEVEIEEAIHEGTEMRFLAAPIRIEPSRDGKGLAVTCQRMELGPPDSSGRRRPVPMEGSEYVEEVTTLVNAIGQRFDAAALKGSEEVGLDRWGNIASDPYTGQTSVPWVFSGGDCSPGDKDMIAVWAVQAGHRAALAIGQFLGGEEIIGDGYEWYSTIGRPGDPAPKAILDRLTPAERARMPVIADAERLSGFVEVELGLGQERGRVEAKRCIVCGCLAVEDCKLKSYGTEYRIQPGRLAGAIRDYLLDDSHPKLLLESGKCLLCGSCVRACAAHGKDVLGFVGRGFNTVVMPSLGRRLIDTACDGCLDCAKVCPTGAIMVKPGATTSS
ncbi:MAG: FAD-dependent oxidoreductase [Polyangia bacterium]|jgi:formate dehydrogenase major subunit|nr:FAD-dependent oxidoreductase [Polyangia bacterium]